jgi:AsmA protein
MDATLSVGASALIYRQFRVDGPVIEGNLIDSKLTIKKFTGKMFDGSFKLAGNFNGRRTPSLDGTVTVAKANVGKALFQAEQFDIQGGITDLSLKVASVGKSPSAMIRSLNGVGSIYSRNGIVKGFDLKSVSDRLKNLDKAINFLSLFGSTMAGGQTRFSALTGSFGIKNGVVRNDDLRLVAEGGEARAAGTADLPRWHMDFNGQFHLTAHPKAPPFTMRAVGPIDNPRRLFKFDKLQAYLLQRGIGSLLRKAFPGSRRQSAPPQQQQQRQQPKKLRLEDLLPGLLKGLGR